MKSKFFQRLVAQLNGVTWYNHKDKMVASTEPLPVPSPIEHGRAGFYEMERLMHKYFSLAQAQRTYILRMHQLMEEFDDEIARWDVQAAKFEEMLDHKNVRKMQSEWQTAITQRDQFANRIKNLEKKPNIISEAAVDKLLKRLDDIDYHFMGTSKEVRRANEVRKALHNLLQQMSAHMKKQNIGDA